MSEPQVKYFLSGASGIRAHLLPRVASLVDYRLLSMHKVFKGNTKVWCEVSHTKESGMKEVMLDSGAFSEFQKRGTKQEHKWTLAELIPFFDSTLRNLNPKLTVWLINLDVIPGTPTRFASPKEIEEALDGSDKNYRILRKRYGDRVLPVYHQTEGLKRLKEVAAMSDYICLGFRQNFSEADRVRHAEEALSVVMPLGKKTHGLATTGYKMLARTAFDSVDSATWLYIAAMGGIMYINDKGEIDSIAVSASSPRQTELRQHYNSLSAEEQALIDVRLKEAGVTLLEVQGKPNEQLGDLSYRIIFNAHQMREWLRAYKRPKVQTEGSLFPL